MQDIFKGYGGSMLPQLKYDEKGLIPAIIQDIENGDVLMMAEKQYRLHKLSKNELKRIKNRLGLGHIATKGVPLEDILKMATLKDTRVEPITH